MTTKIQDTKTDTKEKSVKKEEFTIKIYYANDGKSFQSIAENIILRKMEETD